MFASKKVAGTVENTWYTSGRKVNVALKESLSKMHTNITAAIGNTPLVQVPFIKTGKLFAKLEYLNPGGSVKDRSALYMIEHAEQNGLLKKGGTIIDASSGNHGIALAMIGAMKGYRVIITVSEKISTEKLAAIQAYGAQVVMCPATEFIDDLNSYHNQAKLLHKQMPDSFMPDQYYNTVNRDGHYHLLAPELWEQTDGRITHFFAAAGTGGTISGVGRFLKEHNKQIKIIALDSANSYRSTNGHPKPYKIEGMGIDFDTEVLDETVIDDIIPVTDTDSLKMIRNLANNFGLLAGPSSGSVAHVAQEYARTHFKDGDIGVMIFGDSGRAYLSKGFYASTKKPIEYTQMHRLWEQGRSNSLRT